MSEAVIRDAGGGPWWVRVATGVWVLVLGFLPFFNRHRARLGDLVAGTLVVVEPSAELLDDLVEDRALGGHDYTFTQAQLDVYGIRDDQREGEGQDRLGPGRSGEPQDLPAGVLRGAARPSRGRDADGQAPGAQSPMIQAAAVIASARRASLRGVCVVGIMNVPTRFLDPRVLARIKNLDLVAKTVVDGFMAGLHQSPHLGVSTDFAEHRPYMAGDDIRRVDWRLYGRTDRLYVKEFEAETNANVMVLIDVSKSMDYGSAKTGGSAGTGAVSKLDYARFLAACLIYFSYRQRDRVGVITFDRDVVDQVPATGRQLDTVLHTIDRIRPGGAGELDAPMRRIAKGVRRRSILILISDLYEDPDEVRRATGRLSLRGNDLIVFHVLDPRELAFDFDEPRQFEDLETGERIPVVPERIRGEYRGLIEGHVARIARLLGESRVDYCQVETSRPLDHALHDYLSRRQRLQRVR